MSRAYGLTLLLPSMPARSTERAVVSSMPSGGAGVTDRVTKAVARLWRAACRSPDCRDDRPRGRGRIGAADGESRQCDRWCDVDAHECLQPVDRDRQPDTTASVPNFDIELAVITTVLATAAGHPLLVGQRVTLTIKSARETHPVAGAGSAPVRIRITVRTPPGAGIWGTAGQALADLATRVAGWVRKLVAAATSGLERALPEPLAIGAVLCPALVTQREAAGLARGRVDRQVAGASTGWSQRLPEASGLASTVAGAGIDRRGWRARKMICSTTTRTRTRSTARSPVCNRRRDRRQHAGRRATSASGRGARSGSACGCRRPASKRWMPWSTPGSWEAERRVSRLPSGTSPTSSAVA